MAKQTINLGNSVNDGTGDVLRVGAQKINSNFTELYNLLGGDNVSIVSRITVGPGLTVSSPNGEVTIRPRVASSTDFGMVRVGTGITVDDTGTISTTTYSLPRAATNILGGIKVGSNLAIDSDGVLSALAQPYTLPTASISTLGGVKVGNGLEMINGVLNVTTSEIAAALQSGAVTVQLVDDGDVTGRLKATGPLIVLAGGQDSNDNYLQLQWTRDRDNPDAVKSNYFWLDTNGISLSTSNPIETEFLPQYENVLFYDRFGTLTFNSLGKVGPVQSSGGIDLYASEGMDWTQLNYGDRNYVWVTSTGAYIDISTEPTAAPARWEFNLDSSTVLPGSIEIKGDTDAIIIQLNQLTEDASAKFEEINDVQDSISSKQSELSFWQGVASLGPQSGQYSQALSRISQLSNEIGILQGTLSLLQGELSEIQNNLSSANELLSNPSVTLTYVVEDGVLDINNGAVRFPDGTVQTTAYQGESPATITVNKLVNGSNEITLDNTGTLNIVNKIYSASNIVLESITETTVTAGTNLRFFSDGVFALRNYSAENGISISTSFNTPNQKSWLFNNNGSTTLPTATVPTTAKGAVGDQKGMFIVDDDYIYYCKETYTNGVADIWNRTAQTSWSN